MHGPWRRQWPLAVALGAIMACLCSVVPGAEAAAGAPVAKATIRVVAAENFWGSIAAQLGDGRVEVTSIVANPNVDPHAYEPTPADARAIAAAQVVIINGVGYDPWAPQLLAADGGHRLVLDVGTLLHLHNGDNPHRWYNPADVSAVVAAISRDYTTLQPAAAAGFAAAKKHFTNVALAGYRSLVTGIRRRYRGTPVGASESIFSMLAPALGLRLITPARFLRAISEGTDVSAADKATIDRQIRTHAIKIYVYNSQNTTPDVEAQLAECRTYHIPTATITETMVPETGTYQAWQTRQLRGILRALQRSAA